MRWIGFEGGARGEELQQRAGCLAVRGADFGVVGCVGVVQGDHVGGKSGWGVSALSEGEGGCGVEFGVRSGGVGARAEGLEIYWRLAEVERAGVGEGAVEDANDGVVVFGEVVEEDCVGDLAAFVRDPGGLQRNGFEEVFVGGEMDELGAELDAASDARAVAVDVAEELGELARLEAELAEGLVAGRGWRCAEAGGNEVGVEADESEVVDGRVRKSGPECACVVCDERDEVDLWSV